MTANYLHLFERDREARTDAYDAAIRRDIEADDADAREPGTVIALPGS